MKNTAKVYHLIPFQKYKKFINKCKNKTYNAKLVLHKHHIIPKHIWSSSDNKETVLLSVVDHIKAHILLSECFDIGTYEYNANLRSARVLSKKSIRDKKTLENIRKSYCGINNPFYGKTHTQKTLDILSSNTKKMFKDKSYEDRYGINAEDEKIKRSTGVKNSWDSLSSKDKEIRSLNSSKALKGKNKGKNNSMSYNLIVDDIKFECLQDALSFYNISYYKLFKQHKVEKLK